MTWAIGTRQVYKLPVVCPRGHADVAAYAGQHAISHVRADRMQLNRAGVHPIRRLSRKPRWHSDCSTSIVKVYKDTAMNLSMQTKRAFVTLSLAAIAMVFV